MSDGNHVNPSQPPDTPCGDAAAYALGALEPAEAEAFRAHLQGCTICRDELAAFTTVTDALPTAAVQVPVPPDLRRRVIDQARAEATRSPAADRTVDSPPAESRRVAGGGRERRRIRWPALAGGLVAALAAVAIALIVIIPGGSPGTRVYMSSVGHARLVVSGDHAELVVAKLPVPAGGRTYEVWLLREHHPPHASGLFGVGRSGAGRTAVAWDLSGVSAVAVTQEPAGGTLEPTTRAVVVMPIT